MRRSPACIAGCFPAKRGSRSFIETRLWTQLRYHNTARALDFSQIDAKWQPRWEKPAQWTLPNADKGKYYVLPMFPYPSGALHVGHLRNYTVSDVIARFRRMYGHEVLHPIGWDAFGLPAENAAIDSGTHPARWTMNNIETMRSQIQLMGGCWNWEKELTTCAPEFFKETQRLFAKLFQQGLVYQAEAVVNYDPVDRTVLANEQVDANGLSWRSGAKVERINLKQWFIKITEFAPELLHDLVSLERNGNWPSKVVTMQRHWIGKSEGCTIRFNLRDASGKPLKHLNTTSVFTTRPDTIFGVQYLALSMNHPFVQDLATDDKGLSSFIEQATLTGLNSKLGYRLSGVVAENPISHIANVPSQVKNIPVFVAPYVKSGYGEGAVMGVPAHDVRDAAFWRENQTATDEAPLTVIEPGTRSETAENHDPASDVFTGLGVLTEACQQYHGLESEAAGRKIVADLQSLDYDIASSTTNWKLRDWLISRQRYWGCPIPIVHCSSCGPVLVPDADLPVILPNLSGDFWKVKKGNPLENDASWCETKCPSCGSAAHRETDTMDTFVDSSWYYLQFAKSADTQDGTVDFMPVDLYIGGIEHAILHLLYARFIYKFLFQSATSGPQEPFTRLLTQGMVHGKTMSDPATGKFLKPNELLHGDTPNPIVRSTGETAVVTFEKMSKSKYNGVNPTECIQKYGADVTRAHMLFQAPVNEVLEWDESKITGIQRWFGRIWQLVHDLQSSPDNTRSEKGALQEKPKLGIMSDAELRLRKEVQRIVGSVTESFTETYALNTVISDLMKLTNDILQFTGSNGRDVESQSFVFEAAETLLRLLTPIAPSFAEECWALLHGSLADEESFDITKTASLGGFPQPNKDLEKLTSPSQRCVIQVNGKFKTMIEIPTPPESLPDDLFRAWVIERILQASEDTRFFQSGGKYDIAKSKRVVVASQGRVVNVVL